MLITCPECEAKVSSEAEFCPKCGKPDPYIYSIEICEEIAESARGRDLSGHSEVCRHCSKKKGGTQGFELKGRAKPEIHKTDDGYGVFTSVSCPGCGRRALHRIFRY